MLARDERQDGRSALSHFRAYLARFPGGVFAPEASQSALRELVAEARPGEALTVADDYLRRFPSDARVGEVALVRARLLRDELGRPGEALAAYQALAARELPGVQRDEALFSVGLCEARLGRRAAARESFERYLAQFPEGVHAAEARRRITGSGRGE